MSEALIDEALVADPDADAEMGGEGQAIADEDLHGSRLLLVSRAAEALELDDRAGGAVNLSCTFQPGHACRFVWARLLLNLTEPQGVRIIDVAPREVTDRPVRFTVDRKGNLSLGYEGIASVGTEAGTSKEYEVYHCAVQGSGESTTVARWDFSEDPARRDGLGREQALALTLPVTGSVSGVVTVSARLAREGAGGVVDAIRDMVLGTGKRNYPITVEIPDRPTPAHPSPFQRLN